MRRLVIGALAVSVFGACDTSSEWQAITDAYLAAWNAGDFSGLDAVVAPEVVRYATAPATSAVGLDSLRATIAASRTAYSDLHVTIEETIVVGDRAILLYVVNGTDSLGTQTSADGVSIMSMVNGMLVQELSVWDGLGWMQDLGYVLTPPADSGG